MTSRPGIYIHIPFCIRKCNYCAFLSEPVGMVEGCPGVSTGRIRSVLPPAEAAIAEYVDSLCGEITMRGERFRAAHNDSLPRRSISNEKKSFTPPGIGAAGVSECSTIYLGGGTPSLLQPSQLEKILETVYDSFDISADAEITVEANPATLTLDKLRDYRSLGVNRLSMGVQSFDDDVLKRLGRVHSSADVIRDYGLIRKAGFDNVSMDLIFAVPGTDLNMALRDVRTMTDLQPEHISFYSLQLEEGTPFFRQFEEGELEEIPDDLDREMYHKGCDMLGSAGYEHYEISNFARSSGREQLLSSGLVIPGNKTDTDEPSPYRSGHNSKYWDMSEYIGLGLGASSYEYSGQGDKSRENRLPGSPEEAYEYESGYIRTRNCSDMDEYKHKIRAGQMPFEEEHRNTVKDDIEEAIFTGLRRSEGISFDDIAEIAGADAVNSDRTSGSAAANDYMTSGSATADDYSTRGSSSDKISGEWFRSYYKEAWPELMSFIGTDDVIVTDDGMKLTRKGIDISNAVMALFV